MEKSEIKVNNFIKRYMRICIIILFSASILSVFVSFNWGDFLGEIILELLIAIFRWLS